MCPRANVKNQPLLSSSLQTAHNLRLLPEMVSNLLADLNDAVTLRIAKAFDSAAIGKEVAGKGILICLRRRLTVDTSSSAIKFPSRGRNATEPTSSNKDQWILVLWLRLGRVIEDVANCCIKVYTLEKVLRVKRDAVTQIEFLEEVMKVCPHTLDLGCDADDQTLDEKPSFTFWTTLAKAFESQTKLAAQCKRYGCPPASSDISIVLAAASSQCGLPSFAPAVPRLFRKDRGAYRHGLHMGPPKVSVDDKLKLIYQPRSSASVAICICL